MRRRQKGLERDKYTSGRNKGDKDRNKGMQEYNLIRHTCHY